MFQQLIASACQKLRKENSKPSTRGHRFEDKIGREIKPWKRGQKFEGKVGGEIERFIKTWDRETGRKRKISCDFTKNVNKWPN